jgi:N-acylneuraminate cytidylyltransferase
MSAIAFIHARGGSKRIPRKNIKDFCGQPAIAYPIQAALESGVFDQVIVSTDDEEIAAVAREHGAQTPYMRPAELADDYATTDQVFLNDIKTMQAQGAEFTHAVCIYATSIFLKAEHLCAAVERLKSDDDIHAVISVTEYDFPIYRAFIENENGEMVMREPEYRMTRSQDLPPAYHDAAQFYGVNVEKYLNEGKVFADAGVQSIKIPNSEIVDIDTPDDWVRAEYIYKAMRDSKND